IAGNPPGRGGSIAVRRPDNNPLRGPNPFPTRSEAILPGGLNVNGKAWTFGLLLAASVAAVARAQGDAKDWPMYNRDVVGARHNPGETAIDATGARRLVEKWRFPAEGSGEEIGVIHATPSVVDGYVYFGTATDTAFYKLTPDGKVRWVYRKDPAKAAAKSP